MTIVEFFERQVAETPEAIAVRYEQSDLTYDQLNRRANQLAHVLKNMGVGSEKPVGLFIERSLEMVIGIIGVLKAGGAYVPLDPDYPAERLAFMLEDSQVPILIAQSHLRPKLSTITDRNSISTELKVIYQDSDWDEIAQGNLGNPSEVAKAEALAYIMYTSGSTGQPKGVMIEHRSIFNRLMWMRDALPLTEKDRVLQKSPFSFDASIWEIFWTLLSGARLVIAKPGGHKDSDYLINMIVKEEITAIHFVPSLLQVFLLNNEVDRCHSLKRVICGGETLTYDLRERLFSRLDVELYNQYGPTESAIGVTCWPCNTKNEYALVPIGRPIPNTQIHLLDPQQRPVPFGEPGEIYIGGVQVARGYLNRPELTAEKFIPDPFSTDPTARLYKTGDLGRYLPDGTIHFIGRIDHQVKIRGNRVELGEIESQLGQHSHVREAVVIVHEFTPGDKRLAAYVVLEQEKTFSLSKLRNFLAAKLPSYMIPATFTLLDRLPLTPSGKVDRKALPAPTQARPDLNENYEAPRNPTEETLSRIWEQVIGLNMVGINDNFLELGGDSIQSIHIASRANQAGLRLTPSQVLQYQTIAELATVADIAPTIRAEQSLVTGLLPLTPIQKWIFEQGFSGPHRLSQSYLLEFSENPDISVLEESIRLLLLHHDALRLRFTPDESGWRQVIAPPSETVPFLHVNLSELADAEQKAAMDSTLTELQSEMNLSEGSLLKIALFDLGYQKANYLLLVIHHLVVDGVSLRILLEHLDLLYRQLSHNQSIQFPTKTTSYKYWAQRLTEYAQSNLLKQEIPFWLAMTETKVDHLPVDFSRADGNSTGNSADTVSLSISIEDTFSLLTEPPKAYRAMVTDVLLTALVGTFSRWTGESSLKIDLMGHGREAIFDDVDHSLTVGNFSTIYPVMLNLGGRTNPGEMLISVKEQLRQVPKGGIGYGVLRYLGGEEAGIQNFEAPSQSEVSFYHLGQLDNVLESTSIFKFSHDFLYQSRNLGDKQQYKLSINSGVIHGQLHLTWMYSKNTYQRTTIEKLASDFMSELRNLVTHCKSSTGARYTPSDFPEAELSQQELDELLIEIDENEG